MKPPGVVLALGGARSGKSSFAQRLAEQRFKRPLYVATADPGDAEMAERIRLHRAGRGEQWACAEEPVEIARILVEPPAGRDGILVDCLTLWLSNVMLRLGEAAAADRIKELVSAARTRHAGMIFVSNEVGMGIVPDSALGRAFRDQAGRMNQALAQEADAVVLLVAGLPLALKGEIPA